MPNLSVIFTVGFQNLDDAIDLYKMARHQAGTPPITNIPGMIVSAGDKQAKLLF